jgi:dTMP kinase
MQPGPLFIAFEGIDGCGKSLQAKILNQNLHKLGVSSIIIHEPGSTILGEKIGRILKYSTEMRLDALAELLLFNASRAELMVEAIFPALGAGKVVITDRYIYSTLAYQGYGRGVDLDVVAIVNRIGSHGMYPDLNILLDISPVDALKRLPRKKDRFEGENLSFYEKVRSGYMSISKEDPCRWLVIDASRPSRDIANTVWNKIAPLLNGKSK